MYVSYDSDCYHYHTARFFPRKIRQNPTAFPLHLLQLLLRETIEHSNVLYFLLWESSFVLTSRIIPEHGDVRALPINVASLASPVHLYWTRGFAEVGYWREGVTARASPCTRFFPRFQFFQICIRIKKEAKAVCSHKLISRFGDERGKYELLS